MEFACYYAVNLLFSVEGEAIFIADRLSGLGLLGLIKVSSCRASRNQSDSQQMYYLRGPQQKFWRKHIIMPKKVTNNKKATKRIVHHKDGSVWAKGKMLGNVPDGYWEWFRKEGSKMRSGYFKKVSRSGNGLRTIKREQWLKL